MYLEKGGVAIPYTGGAEARKFTYSDVWTVLSHSRGLSTFASETLVVSGAGFEVGSNEYSCQFEKNNYKLGVAGTVASSFAIECITPHWKFEQALTRVTLYKQNCNGARGVAGSCTGANIVQNDNVFRDFTFVQAARNLSINSALASHVGIILITVFGGGFESDRTDYAIEWRVGNDSVKLNVTDTHTAYFLEVELPQWAFTPNQVANVRVFAGDTPLSNSFDSTMTFEWQSAWTSFVDETPPNRGTSAGGELVTINGQGFAVNASHTAATYLVGVGIDNDYACKFTDAKGFFLLSQRVEPVSNNQIVCTTPAWGLVQVAVNTQVTLLKGAYEYAGPLVDFTFLSSWQTLSATTGPVGGSVLLTLNGVGFNASKTFECKFSYNSDELYAYTDPVLPVSANRVIFTTPRWPSWREGKTKLIIFEGGAEVLQIVEGGGGLATYEFLPGFIVSQKRLDIKKGDLGYFSFYPDTEPTGVVTIRAISNDTSIAAVSSPYTMNVEGKIEGNTRDVSVRCLRPGSVSIALASEGANFGNTFLDQAFVICRASIDVDKESASMTRGSTTLLQVTLDPKSFEGNVSISISSSDINIFTAMPSMLIFQNYTTRAIQLRCTGVGRAHLGFHVVSDGGNFLYNDVTRTFTVYGMPGYAFPITIVNLLPGESSEIEFAPDTSPSLKTDFIVQVTDPSIAGAQEKVYFPAMRTTPKKFTVSHIKPGTTTVNVIGRSAGLLQQVSIGCSTPDAVLCTEKFVDFGCKFQGSNLTGGDNIWISTLNNVSSASGVTDCSQYRGCFRASCCNSPVGKQCIAAVQNTGCSLLKIVPLLSTTEDPFYDFGAVPADLAKTDLLYKTWVHGIDCQPYVPCAWSQCFPGAGNFESVTSQSVTIKAFPGFTISPQPVNLHQGRPVQLQIALQSVPSGPVNARIHLVDTEKMTLTDPSLYVSPVDLFFSPDSLDQNITVQWLKPGRVGFLLVADKHSLEYANVSHFFADLVSASPGFVFTQVDPKSDKGELVIRNGVPNMYIKKDQDFEIMIKPDFKHTDSIDVYVAPLPNGMLQLQVDPSSMNFAGNRKIATELTARSSNVGESTVTVKRSGPQSGIAALHVLDSGVGYTPGSIGISKYGGAGFLATYKVGVVGWGFYVDGMRASRAGANYSYQGSPTFQINQSSPFHVSVGSCYRAATPVPHPDDADMVTDHSGVRVRGCTPDITAFISAGILVDVTFDSTSCLATGITCRLSLESYGGTGFHGYFSTGITETTITSSGSGYTCDWACFVTIISGSGLSAVKGHGFLGHAQTCPFANPTCADGYLVTAVLYYGNTRDLETDIKIIAFAAASITADISVIRQTQTSIITVTPLELPTGNVTFTVSASTALLQLTHFSFTEGASSLMDAAQTFTVTHMGGGSSRAKVSIFGKGTGNYDGFTGSIEIDLLPGFNVSVDTVNLQLFPGHFIVRFGPDSIPNKDTQVLVHVSTDFGTDILLGSYGEKLLSAPAKLTMPAGTKEQQDLRIIHGGFGAVKMRNRVAGTATITFSVSDAQSVYDGIGIDGPTKTIFVDVKPGFESNIQDTHMRYLQADSLFPLTITLDQATTQAINISAVSSNETIARVTPLNSILAGSTGPVYFNVQHQGILGEAYISLNVETSGGNYDSVAGVQYMKVLAVPGLSVSTKFVHLQYVKRIETVDIGLDTKPDADVDISITSSDPHIVGVTSSISFKALEWTPSTRKTITVMWHGVGDISIQCVCKSPGGNYNQVYRTDLVQVRSFRPLQVSRTKVRVQKYGKGEFSVSTAVKPTKDTLFTVMSSPVGIVEVSGPYLIRPGTNDTFVVNMTHIQRGHATVRVFASAPGDIYDGAAADIQVSAMPGFLFSQQEILLYSCPRTSKCVKTFTFAPEIVPSEDVTVTITSSDNSIVSISPSQIKLFAANGTNPTELITATYLSPGLVCLSFAATSVGNYDLVSAGGVTVISLPDFAVGNLIITPVNGGQPHGIHDFVPERPIIYVQKLSFSTFTIRPTVVPVGDSVVHIHNPRPDLVDVTQSVIFKEGETTSKIVTVTHKAVGNVYLSLLGEGGNYDRAAWEHGIFVKALPSLTMSTEDTMIKYRFVFDFIAKPSDLLVDSTGGPSNVRLNVSVEDVGSLELRTPSIVLRSGDNETITVRHTAIFVDPSNPFDGETKLSIRAYGPDTNYHHVEAIISLRLDYPGFGISKPLVNVQRWNGSALTGTIPGNNRVTLTPNEIPDSQTTISFQSNSQFQEQCLNSDANGVPLFCPVESQEWVETDSVKFFDERNRIVWYAGDGQAGKYIQATHEGIVGQVMIVAVAPVGAKWPADAKKTDADNNLVQCTDSDATCPGFFGAVYAGIVRTVPNIQIVNHAGFVAPRTVIDVQRQSEGEFEMKLDTLPAADTTVYFTSSDPSIVSVQDSIHFFKGEDLSYNITVFAVSPGVATISFRAESSEFDYNGAEALGAITVNAMKGIGLSKLVIYLQSPPAESGQATFTITPDTTLDFSLTVNIASSNTAQVTCTPSVTFPFGPVIPQPVTVTHISSGSAESPVMLTYTVVANAMSDYAKVRILPSKVIPLGTFVVSHTSIRVQKAMSAVMTISPNVAPDEDVKILITVTDTSVVTASTSIVFLAKKMDAVPFTLLHVGAGLTKLSFDAVSVTGNYVGSYLNDAVSVEALHGFQAFMRVVGVKNVIPGAHITTDHVFLVQSQPTSHLSYAHFVVTTDVIPNQETVVMVKSSDDSIVTTISNVTFSAGVKEYKAVTVVHGGRPGEAKIYFSASSVVASGNYNGLESGNVRVKAAPGFVFSSTSVNVQQNQIANITVRPDMEPTEDIVLSIVISDPSVINVTETLTFSVIGGVGPKNTKIISIGYEGLGTAALSFFTKGGNFEGVIYSNSIVAASRPGFIISESEIDIPYDGSYVVTFQADTVPTDDAIVIVASSQPAKAAPSATSFLLKAGSRDVFHLNIKSWCSVSPGNCARAGKAIISFQASSIAGGGNYDGVETTTAITVSVSAPELMVSVTELYVQENPGVAFFTVKPTVPLNRDTIVSFESMDPAVCSPTVSVLFLKDATNEENTKQVVVNHLSVGDTYVRVFINQPLDSNYVNIDPVLIYVRTLATLDLAPSVITLQPLTSISVSVAPAIEIDSILSVSLGSTDSSVMTVSPLTLTFTPPRNLIGSGVNVAIGIRVVLAEKFQVYPRLGVGTIMRILNDNLDLVSVHWDSGLKEQEYAIGNSGRFMLAQYEDLMQTITINHVFNGNASVFFEGHAPDVNYNGLNFQNAIVAHTTPSFVCSSSDMVLQYERSTSVTILPRVAPSSDISVQIRVVTVGEQKQGTIRTLSDVVQVRPQYFEMYRVDSTSVKNQRALQFYCAKTGSVQIEFEGTGGNYDDVLYHPIQLRCLPGLLVNPSLIPVLSSPGGSAILTVGPNVVPTERVTIVVTATKEGVIWHTLRLYFAPFVENQVQELSVEHGQGYFDDDCKLSLQGYGGNFDGVDIPEIIHVRVARPDLVVPLREISVQPNTFTTLPVYLDTKPSLGTYITATSSDPTRATINGPLLVYDTSVQVFTISHVEPGPTTITFSVSALKPGSTYSNVTLSLSLSVAVTALGSGFIVSSSQVNILQHTPQTITIGPDAIPDSRVELIVETEPVGIVSVSPSVVYFGQGIPSQFATFQLTWLMGGDCVINLKSMGGNFQSITRHSFVTVNALPMLPAAPLNVHSTRLVDKKLQITFSPPATFAETITGYLAEISDTTTFTKIIESIDLEVGATSAIFGPLVRGMCYYYRVVSRNRAGLGARATGAACSGVLDSPSVVRNVEVKTISEASVLLQWLPPADSGDGTPDGMPILQYIVQVRLEDGALSTQMTSPADRRSAVLRIMPSVSYTVNINTVTAVSELQVDSASLQVAYSGVPLRYDVPLAFTFSATAVVAPIGVSTSVLITPVTPPYLDAVVHVSSSNEQSAESTPRLVFKKGSVAPQHVIISHKRKGVAVLSFLPEGGYFKGLDATVTIETLSSEESPL